MNIEYKVLTVNEVLDYKSIRLELLKNNPTNFGSSFEQESQFPNEHWEKRLKNSNATTIGAYDGYEIIGICVIIENPRLKMKHKAILNSMYVVPAYRGKGVSKGILITAFQYLIDRDVEIFNLSVVSTNETAIKLYQNAGFVKEGSEKKAIKYNGKYYDLVLMQKYF